MEAFDAIIVGGGAAAWSAAIYARRYNLETLLIEEEFGGETSRAGIIENYPGFARIDGFDLMDKMKGQAVTLGVRLVDGRAALVQNRYHCFRVRVGKDAFQGKTIILATGMEHRKLGLSKEDALKGKGIHYCATCDGPLFKGKRVAVVGGGDSAVKWANQLSDMGAAQVTLIVREPDLSRAEPINRARLEGKRNVDVLFGNEIVELIGDARLEAVRLKHPSETGDRIALDAVFVAIGAVPRGELPGQLGVRLDAFGQVEVDPRTLATSVDGVFAAGDVTNASGAFKQIVTGAAQGAIAATSAYHDVTTHPATCGLHAVPVVGLLPASTPPARRRASATKKRRA
ncbi:MAG: thioredoxin reductase [Lysobacteraceae bacterium]|nr:MAG: thioredoxin reductase [Xanthomonadaceae bacterium]